MEKKKLLKIIIPVALAVVAAVVLIVVFSGQKSSESFRYIKVNGIDGNADVQRRGTDAFSAFAGLQLESEDNVEVREKSFLELLVDSDKHIGAEENTGFAIRAEGSEKNGKITIDLLYGKALFTIDNKLPDGSSFVVKSPNATLSVRGTSFSVEYNRVTGETVVEVFAGTVLAEYVGKTETLNIGDRTVISGTNAEESSLPQSSQTSQVSDSKPVVQLFRAVPDNGDNRIDISIMFNAGGNFEYGDFMYVNGQIWNTEPMSPLDESALQIDKQYISSHIAEINNLYEDSREADLQLISEGKPVQKTDVSAWFPETLVIKGDKGTYTCHISRAELEFGYSGTHKAIVQFYGSIE